MRIYKTVGLLLLCGVVGCGSSGPDAIFEQMIATKKQAATVLEEIRDDTSAEAALAKVDKLVARYDELGKQMQSHPLSPERADQLINKYLKQNSAATEALSYAVNAAQKRAPGHARQIGSVLEKLGIYQSPSSTDLTNGKPSKH